MASPSIGFEIFSRGFRFSPSPLDAATYYIPRLAAGAPLHDAVRLAVHRADVYASEPGDLARLFPPMPKAGHRFFFTQCKLQHPHKAGKASKPARAGSWHSQGRATDVVDAAGVKVGEMRKLRYRKGGAYTDWLMDEFSTLCSEEALAGDKQFVLCNIYVSPRAAPDSAARRESAAYFEPPAPVVIPQAAAAAGTKRPAPPQIAEPPCPKRTRRIVVAPIPPVVQPAGYCTPSFAPPRPCVPRTTASAQLPPPPLPTRFAAPPSNSRSPAPAPPQKPKQQTPLPTPPLVPTCQIPAVQAPARHCPPQPSEKTKQRILDPFEAAEMIDEAEEEDDWDDVIKCLEDDAEGSTMMTEEEVEQHFKSLLD
ncbi:unnamed protein product [Urochloa humidicola]